MHRAAALYCLPLTLLLVLTACGPDSGSDATGSYAVIIRGGILYDGTGAPGRVADLAMDGERIMAIGDLSRARAELDIDARGKAVAPGFINMLSWATESLIADGASQSDLRQGVTLQVFGEGSSYGPLDDTVRQYLLEQQGPISFDITWTTLGEYLEHLEARGVACNVASLVGATTVRLHEVGFEPRAPTPEELERMRGLVRQAMDEGALGLGSALYYVPANHATVDEIAALAEVVAEDDGIYMTHLRDEGAFLLESFHELRSVVERSGVRAEIYHLKASGAANAPLLDDLIVEIEAARAAGLDISANIYPYTAAATGFDAAMPAWVQEGGLERWIERLQDPELRRRVLDEINDADADWENLLHNAGPSNIHLSVLRNEELRPLTGKSLAEVAEEWGLSPAETMVELVIRDRSSVGATFFLMAEENIEKKIALPYVTFGSDATSIAAEGRFLETKPHPRTYGTFARVLGKYTRDRQVLPLAETIHRLTGMPAERLRLEDRGQLQTGYFADVVVFDPATVQDHATYDDPHQYATGIEHVFVNGVAALRDGEPTDARPGQVVRGPGWKGSR